MQASMVHALGHVAFAASPRAGAKAVTGKARALATPTLSVRARASANARCVSVKAAAPAAIGSSFARNAALNAVVAKQTELRSHASRTVVKCDASADSASASSGNPLESFFAKNPQLETVCYFALWYWLNIQFNIINKQIYNYFPFPWFVSAVHLAVGLLIMTFFWTTRLVKYEKPDKEFLKAVTLPSFLHAFGHCLTNVSFAAVAVSLTHTIKTLEPVFSAAGSFLVNGTVYAFPVYLALLPIIGGVALASATELSFSWLGFSTAMASNVAFSARAIFSKKLMSRMSPLNLYNFVTIVSLLFCIPFVFAFEGSTLAAGIQKAIEIKGQKEFTIALLKVGAFYHLYNQVAYQALGKVEPVTHAVGNVGKRIFVIGFTILAFGNKISAQTAIGSGIAVVGAGLYGWLKAKYADQTKTLKRD
jgi:solute carrier family 35 protein E1